MLKVLQKHAAGRRWAQSVTKTCCGKAVGRVLAARAAIIVTALGDNAVDPATCFQRGLRQRHAENAEKCRGNAAQRVRRTCIM
jgi:hypothetical protein